MQQTLEPQEVRPGQGLNCLRELLEGDAEVRNEARKAVMAAMRKHPCDRCGAGAGEACVSESGRLASLEHSARYRRAVEFGDLPIDLGEFY